MTAISLNVGYRNVDLEAIEGISDIPIFALLISDAIVQIGLRGKGSDGGQKLGYARFRTTMTEV
jgi:hypothetical protein